MADLDLPLDLFGGQDADPWALKEPEPTTLIALWPHDQPPTMTEVQAALRRFLGDEVEVGDDPPTSDDAAVWTAVFDLPASSGPVIMWCEPAQPIPPGELDDPQAEACKWVVGATAVLDNDDPLSSYTSLMRAMPGSFEDIPAILDVNCARWHLRQDVNRLFLLQNIEPPADVLWIIHVVQKPAEGTAWLHTHGLWRCGRPELELLQIPGDCIGSACALLSTVAELSLDEPLPKPSEPMEVGRDLVVTLEPWREAAKCLDDETPGSIISRQADADDPHQGIRAVVCESNSQQARRATRSWPKDVVGKLQRHEVALYRTQRATGRQAALAVATWSQLTEAFALVSERAVPGWSFLIKAGFTQGDNESPSREHLWFELLRVEDSRAHGRLLNEPATILQLKKGDAAGIDTTLITDWRANTPFGDFGPDEAAAMSRALEQLKGKAVGSP